MAYAELFMRLSNLGTDTYAVELEFSSPGAEMTTEPEGGQAVFDFERLMGALDDTESYARVLTENLFADAGIRSSFLRADHRPRTF